MRVAIIDDAQDELNKISNVLKHAQIKELQHLDIDYYTDSETLIKNLDTYDFFILDWYIDHMTGLDLLKRIRQQCSPQVSVIMVTINNIEEDISTALVAGADDYLVKPFRGLELCARIFNVMRRTIKNSTTAIDNGWVVSAFSFNDHALKITIGEEIIKLTSREYQIAKYLFMHLGEPVSRKTLYDAFWEKEEAYYSRTLDTHIYRIRTQLKLTVEFGWQLHTIYGYGYRLEHVNKNLL